MGGDARKATIVPVDMDYLKPPAHHGRCQPVLVNYRFLHDRVQQATSA